MTWSYRIVHKVYDGADEYTIHEIYYDNEGNPQLITVNPIAPYGNTHEEFKEDMKYYLMALEKPVLEYDEIDWQRGNIFDSKNLKIY